MLLSWLERQADTTRTALRVARLDSAGRWSDPSTVIAADDLFVNWADFPSAVPLADGRILAHWLHRNGQGKYAYDVRLALSADSGRTWMPAGLPHPPGVAVEHGFVTLLPRADSTADVIFLSGTLPPPGAAAGYDAQMILALSHVGRAGHASPVVTTLDARTCTCCQTAATRTSRGAVVLYRDRSDAEIRDIAVVRTVNGAWTTPVPLHTDGWEIKGCPVNGPAIASAGDTVVAVWFTGARDTNKVQLTFSTDAGASFGPPVRIDDGRPMGRLDVKLIRGDALVTWTEQVSKDSAEVRARLVRPDGTREAPLRIATVAAGRASGFPRLAHRGADVVLAWTEPGVRSTVRLATLRVAPR